MFAPWCTCCRGGGGSPRADDFSQSCNVEPAVVRWTTQFLAHWVDYGVRFHMTSSYNFNTCTCRTQRYIRFLSNNHLHFVCGGYLSPTLNRPY